MPQNPRRRDESPLARKTRQAYGNYLGAKEALEKLGPDSSPLDRMKLKRDAAQASQQAYETAVAYRNSRKKQ